MINSSPIYSTEGDGAGAVCPPHGRGRGIDPAQPCHLGGGDTGKTPAWEVRAEGSQPTHLGGGGKAPSGAAMLGRKDGEWFSGGWTRVSKGTWRAWFVQEADREVVGGAKTGYFRGLPAHRGPGHA